MPNMSSEGDLVQVKVTDRGIGCPIDETNFKLHIMIIHGLSIEWLASIPNSDEIETHGILVQCQGVLDCSREEQQHRANKKVCFFAALYSFEFKFLSHTCSSSPSTSIV